MLTLIQKHRWWFLLSGIAAVLLRLFFVLRMPVLAGDTLIYGDIAKCLISNHMFGVERASGWQPTLIRLPGYPFFIAFTFLIFGQDRYFGAMLFQLVFDLLTWFLVADIARRVVSDKAARIAFLLTALCPFLAIYVATPLTECLEIFFITAAIDCAIIALDQRRARQWVLCAFCCACAILLRPDGGLILGCIALPVLWVIYGQPARRRELFSSLVLLFAISLSPLVPWTIRNWRTFHLVQPLVNKHATDPGEYVPAGWELWFKTWLVDYSNVEDVAFKVPEESIDIGDIPDRAYDSSEQRALVHSLIDQYNATHTMSPDLDARFAALARENIHRHPMRFYVLLPAARVLDMWFRPRTEMFPVDTHFWDFKSDPRDAWLDLGLAALNFAYVACALAGAWLLRRHIRYLPLLLTYPIVRSLFLATTGMCEDRYTLECFPFVLVLAAAFLATRHRTGAAEVAQLQTQKTGA